MKDLDLGWNELKGGSHVLLLPNNKKEIIPYASHKSKNGHKYYNILMTPDLPSWQCVYYKTKNINKAKEVKLRVVKNKYKKVLEFINNLD